MQREDADRSARATQGFITKLCHGLKYQDDGCRCNSRNDANTGVLIGEVRRIRTLGCTSRRRGRMNVSLVRGSVIYCATLHHAQSPIS